MGQVSKSKAKLWAKHKKQLAEGRDAYWDYVSLLIEVVESGSYLEDYQNRDQFLKHEAGFSRQHFARLQTACEVRQRLSPVGDIDLVNEAQLREVAKAPPEKQAKVYAVAAEAAELEGRTATAKDMAKARRAVVGETPKPTAKPTTHQREPGDESEPDGEDPIPEWENAIPAVDSIRRDLNALIKLIKDFPKGSGRELVTSHSKRMQLDLGNVKATIVGCVPYGICPHCHGNNEDCEGCSGRGWLNKSDWNMSPKELRDEVERLPSGGRS